MVFIYSFTNIIDMNFYLQTLYLNFIRIIPLYREVLKNISGL